jgi:microtubule-associated protein-like 6
MKKTLIPPLKRRSGGIAQETKKNKKHQKEPSNKSSKINKNSQDAVLFDDGGGFKENKDFEEADEAGNPDGNIMQEQWRSTLELPDHLNAPNSNSPNLNINLDYVFGFRTKDVRNNAKYIDSNSIIYHAGNLAIIQNLKTKKQKFFSGHKNDITSFTINKDKTLSVTAEKSEEDNKSIIIVWDIKTLKEDFRMKIDVECIKDMEFNPNSSLIALVGVTQEKYGIYIIDTKFHNILCSETGVKYKILDLVFKNNDSLMSVGIKHCMFWTIKDNKLYGKDGLFAKEADTKLGVVVLFNEENYITGSATGQIVIWENEKFKIGKKVHSRTVDTIYANNKVIISGARDMSLVILDKDLTECRRIQLEINSLKSVSPNPRSIDMLANSEAKILLGTIAGEIYELNFERDIFNSDYNSINYISSHYSTSSKENNQITDIVYWKSNDLFITSCEDGTIRFWNCNDNKIENYLRFDNNEKNENLKPTCLTLNNNEDLLVIGFDLGNIKFYNTNNFELTNEIKDNDKPINSLKYSPNSSYLAVGTSDNKDISVIKIYNPNTYQLITRLIGQNGPIINMDFSMDSQYISSSSEIGEFRVFSVTKGVEIIKYDKFKDEEWNSWNRIYGWPLMGYYDSNVGKITSCERYEKKIINDRIIAIGEESGNLKIYKYPIVAPNQMPLTADENHSGKVSHLKFSIKNTNEDIVLMTSSDGVLYKWNISRKKI